MLKLFEYKQGKLTLIPQLESKRIRTIVLSSLVLMILLFLGNWLKLTPDEFWKAYVTITRHFGLEEGPPDTQKKLDARVELDANEAIAKVTPEYNEIIREADKKYRPIYIELEPNESLCYTEACKSLEPPMRICAPWAENCTK